MGRTWLAAIEASDDVELVALADLDQALAREAVRELGRDEVAVGADAVALAAGTGARAIIDVTSPPAHHPVTVAALAAGLPVLGEKPAAATLAQAVALAAASEVAGRLFMVSQSRRWNPHVESLRACVQQVAPAGLLTTEFFRAPRFGGFREEMAQPLLVDMAIHPFDTARYVLGADPVRAWCHSHNPSWSWYDGDAAATAVFEMAGGAVYTYTGSWCSPGDETSWNGRWRVSGAGGSARWDGDTAPTVDPVLATAAPAAGPGRRSTAGSRDAASEGIEAALAAFVEALRTGTTPSGAIRENLMSLAMVEAAVESAATATHVVIDDLLERARDRAMGDEVDGDVRAAMAAWASVADMVLPPAGT